MAMTMEKIADQLRQQIENFTPGVKLTNVGKILSVGDGVAQVDGLSEARMGEILVFPQRTHGLVLNLKKETTGAIILGKWEHLKEGDEVKTTGKILEVGVGEGLLGRVINPLGEPLDGRGPVKFAKTLPIEQIAPGVSYRQPVDTPLQTGIRSIDSMIPIGRGQRELIIGDRGIGKTALTIDAIINQKHQKDESGKPVCCIYVAIGQKQSKVAQLVAKLEEFGALEHTIVVSAGASDPVALQYLAPYAGCAMGEYFMEKGKDALVVYDDLSKHAWAYRQISLVLRRPSGREAYPGDIFYLHSRLLERACRMKEENGGGSLTALPIIETQAGDISAYIPTNVISITDGQIYLESDLFYAGFRPALNVGLSVSRVGGAAQIRAMKQVAGKLRLDLAQYRELSAFAQFGTDLDKSTRERLDRGARISEILKQSQYEPMPVEKQILSIWMVTNGFLDEVSLEKCQEFEIKYLEFMEKKYPKILNEIREEKKLSEGMLKEIEKAAKEFNQQWQT
ncbi:MAG: F0F1 ATP synthase subunit alpha [bacterium]|nr:F0F1 ATP synthase subunit alpha [bacterium]